MTIELEVKEMAREVYSHAVAKNRVDAEFYTMRFIRKRYLHVHPDIRRRAVKEAIGEKNEH